MYFVVYLLSVFALNIVREKWQETSSFPIHLRFTSFYFADTIMSEEGVNSGAIQQVWSQ